MGDIGRPFRMRLALWVVRIQYRDSFRRLVFSPYNKFCNLLQLRNFLSGNFLEPGCAESHPRSCAIPDQYPSTRPSSFNRARTHLRHILVLTRHYLGSYRSCNLPSRHFHSYNERFIPRAIMCLFSRLVFDRSN